MNRLGHVVRRQPAGKDQPYAGVEPFQQFPRSGLPGPAQFPLDVSIHQHRARQCSGASAFVQVPFDFIQGRRILDAKRNDALKRERVFDVFRVGDALHVAQAELVGESTHLPRF